MEKICDLLDVLVRRGNIAICVKRSQPLNFLTIKREVTSATFNGSDFSFTCGSRLVLFASQEGDSTIVLFPMLSGKITDCCVL